MDDWNRHRATGTTMSHHRKQRYTLPPLAKHANDIERAKNRRLRRNFANPKNSNSKDQSLDVKQRPISSLHAPPNPRGSLRDRLQNPKTLTPPTAPPEPTAS
ncbi:hypothetical protein Bca4012_018117 [Brassica carinata]